MNFGRLCLFLAALALLALPAGAQDAAISPSQPAPAIATKVGASENTDIEGRIRSIFSEIDSLRGVRVRASAGVVTLSGTVPNVRDIGRAEAIASRVQGVVTVQNDVSRDTSVDTSVVPVLGQFGKSLQNIIRALPLIGIALGLGLAVGFAGYFLASRNRLWQSITPNPFFAEMVATLVRFSVVILGLITTLEILGATALLGGVLGGAGIAGIALGLAVRDTISNYFSSLMLSLRQPFRANDHVVIEGNEGRVIRLTSRATILMTLDGNHLRIPNSTVFNAVILNYTRNSERRFQFDLGIDASDNPVDGMAVGLAAIEALAFVLAAPKATAIIQQIGDSNIVLRFFGWIDQRDTDFNKGRSLAIHAAKTALESSGFALPEPIYRLRFGDAVPESLHDIKPTAPMLSAKRAQPPDAAPQMGDTAPDRHIADMVENERSQDSDSDLLDEARPVE